MPELKLRQLAYETDTWKRLIIFMMDENIHLKKRLSEILAPISNTDLLEEIEDFQSRFIKEDKLIGLLRNDIAELDKLLEMELFKDGKILKEITTKSNTIRINIANSEIQFSKLKMEFNNYLLEILDNNYPENLLINNS